MFDEITVDDRSAFDRDGFVIKRGLFSREEIALVHTVMASDPAIAANAVAVSDSGGAATELALWNHPSDDVFGAMARSRRMAIGATRLLRGEVYHYHTKLTMKRPRAGGAWDWHQDYGYWYQNGCLWPDMLSVGVAIDAATLENGCLEVLTGSHRLGRIEHGRVGGQTGADPERVAAIMAVCPPASADDGTRRRGIFPLQHAAQFGPQRQRRTAHADAHGVQSGEQQPGRRVAHALITNRSRSLRTLQCSPPEAVWHRVIIFVPKTIARPTCARRPSDFGGSRRQAKRTSSSICLRRVSPASLWSNARDRRSEQSRPTATLNSRP